MTFVLSHCLGVYPRVAMQPLSTPPRQHPCNLLQALLQQDWGDVIHARCFVWFKGHDSLFDPLRRDHLPCCAPISLSTIVSPAHSPEVGEIGLQQHLQSLFRGPSKTPVSILISLSSRFEAHDRSLKSLAVSLIVPHSEHHFLQELRFTSLMRFL